MFTLALWILIAVLGLILYVYPALTVRRMYEGFDSKPGTTPEAAAAAVATAAAAAAAKDNPEAIASPPDMASLLQKVEALMAPQIATPDLDSVVAETPSAKPKAKGLKAQPESVKEIRSEPGEVEEGESPSGALEHGKSFQDKKPRRAPEEEEEETPTASCAPKKKATARRPSIPQTCPPAVQCPNMRDYIRKDSIPCWACKLK
jgi:hypothetical protein